MPSRTHSLSKSASNSAAGQDAEEHLAEGIGRVINSAAEGQLDAAGEEGVTDVAGVGDEAGEPVELGHNEGAAGPDGGQGSGPGRGGRGWSTVRPLSR